MYKCSQWGATEKAACVCEVLSFIYGDVRKQLRQIVEVSQTLNNMAVEKVKTVDKNDPDAPSYEGKGELE